VSNTNDTLSTTITEIQNLPAWAENNGLIPPKSTSVSRACEWITELSSKQQWVPPNAISCNLGDIVLSWHSNQRSLCVYIDGPYVSYYQSCGVGAHATIIEGSIASMDKAQELWQWFIEDNEEALHGSN
jgi:hypothetical protein